MWRFKPGAIDDKEGWRLARMALAGGSAAFREQLGLSDWPRKQQCFGLQYVQIPEFHEGAVLIPYRSVGRALNGRSWREVAEELELRANGLWPSVATLPVVDLQRFMREQLNDIERLMREHLNAPRR